MIELAPGPYPDVVSSAPPEFYDGRYASGASMALVDWSESPLAAMYMEAQRWIARAAEVIDLGCGTGQFAQLLADRQYVSGYLGMDFSAVAIRHARSRRGVNQEFDLMDLRDWAPHPATPLTTVFVCTETLEHLDDDLELVEKIPPGRRLILSVPNYDSESHVRVFPTVGSVWARYSPLVSFKRWSLIELTAGNAVHLCDTVRRADSWGDA